MAIFTLDADNNITAYAEPPADAGQAAVFSTETQLAKLTADWPLSRLVETWNGFAGVVPFDDLRPVKKFTNRKQAVARIWKAIQRLAADIAPQGAPVATPKARSKKSSTPRKGRVPARPSRAAVAREGSKKAEVLDLLRQPQGATLAEIMKTTGWQAHTVRGFVSGTLTKKLGLTVESFRNEDKQRVYRINP